MTCVVILLMFMFFLYGCISNSIEESSVESINDKFIESTESINNPDKFAINKTENTVIEEQSPIADNELSSNEINVTEFHKTDYVVIVNESSPFIEEARFFAQHKNATLITYHKDINETLNALKIIKPNYTVIFATPEELTVGFTDGIDLLVREFDDDPYLDTAYGFITSRNAKTLRNYIERLLAYSPHPNMTVYGLGDYSGSPIGSKVITNCLSSCAGAICVCDDANRATLDRVKENFANAELIKIGAHGTPSTILLDNNEMIIGTPHGLAGKYANGTESELKTNAILVLAISCTTARINGGSPINETRFGNDNETGNISSSIVLSFLQSGALNYIGATHVATTSITPLETLGDESFRSDVPIGVALKDLKNRYIMVTEKYKVNLEGSPVNTNEYSRDFVLFNLRNWVLFGDPSIRLISNVTYVPSCVSSYKETQKPNGKIVTFTTKGSNSFYIDSIDKEDYGMIGMKGCDTCIIKVPYQGKLESISASNISGVDRRYLNYDNYPANIFYQDLGDEIMFGVPLYIASGSKRVKITYEINISSQDES